MEDDLQYVEDMLREKREFDYFENMQGSLDESEHETMVGLFPNHELLKNDQTTKKQPYTTYNIQSVQTSTERLHGSKYGKHLDNTSSTR